MFLHYEVLAASIGMGAGNRGTKFGPSALLKDRLIYRLNDSNLKVSYHGEITEPPLLKPEHYHPKARYKEELLVLFQEIYEGVLEIYNNKSLPVIFGGDHSISIGSISAAASYLKNTKGGDLGVVWIDAHPDLNTPLTTPSGNIHGMSLSALLGIADDLDDIQKIGGWVGKIKPENIILIGIRSIDPGEREIIETNGITLIDGAEMATPSGASRLLDALSSMKTRVSGLALSFDTDVLDPKIAPGVGTPVAGGISLEQAVEIIRDCSKAIPVILMDFVEYNPDVDINNQTSKLLLQIIQFALSFYSTQK